MHPEVGNRYFKNSCATAIQLFIKCKSGVSAIATK